MPRPQFAVDAHPAERVGVVRQRRLDRPVEGELAGAENDRALRQCGDRREIVADEQDGAAAAGDLRHPVEAARLELGIAHRQDLVDHQDLGFEMGRHREGQPGIHADGVALDRRVDELLDAGEVDDLVEAPAHLDLRSCRGWRRSGRCSRGRVSSGWKPVPTSSRLVTRPSISTRPSVGSVMRDRILSSVVLPAPLWPMMLTSSPRLISKLTSRSAQNSSMTSPSMTGPAPEHVDCPCATGCARRASWPRANRSFGARRDGRSGTSCRASRRG